MAELLDRTFPARTEDLSAVRAAVREACQRAHCTEEASEQVVLAINEACMNIIKHGYGFAAGQGFTLRMGVNDDVLMVQLLDNGLPAKDEDLRPGARCPPVARGRWSRAPRPPRPGRP